MPLEASRGVASSTLHKVVRLLSLNVMISGYYNLYLCLVIVIGMFLLFLDFLNTESLDAIVVAATMFKGEFYYIF